MAHADVDLYLGGRPGLWVLEEVAPGEVHCVVTREQGLAGAARRLGFAVVATDPHADDFRPGGTCLSVHYPRILKEPLLARYRHRYNLHPGYLPWGRGYFPVFWALWEGTPAGATLHEMTPGVDEGPVVEQERVPYADGDTGGALHARVMEAERRLFRRHWPRIAAGGAPAGRPQEGHGSYHPKSEFTRLKEGDAWQSLPADRLRRLVRCLTMPGYPNLRVARDGKLHELRLDAAGAVEYFDVKPEE
jgi:methionyl-tRNA formyltransferase